MKKIMAISGLLIWSILLFFSPVSSWSEEFKIPYQKEYAIKKPFDLELDDPRGEIILESHNQNKIIIQAFKIVDAKNRNEAEILARRISIDIEVVIRKSGLKSGSFVRVETEYQKEGFLEKVFTVKKSVEGYVSYHILVPKDIHQAELSVTSGKIRIFNLSGHLNLFSTSGDMEITGVEGNISGSVTSGDIRVKEVKGEINLQGTSSDIKLKKIKGKLEIVCTSGSVFVEDLNGSLKSTQTSGDLEVKELSGDLSSSNTSGDIRIEQSRGSADLSTTSGDIEARIQISPSDYYSLRTISGDINLYVSKDAQADLKIETTSGEISVNVPMVLRSISRHAISGTLGSRGGEVEINTVSGDINLEEY